MREADASSQHDVHPRLRLQLGDPLDGVTGEHRRVLPLGVGHRRGHHILGDPVEVVGHTGLVIGLFRPVAAEVLECLPSDQQRIGLRVLAMRLLEQNRVLELRVEPVVEHLD